MFRKPQTVRIYVRNKARYNPESKERNFLFVDITDFAGTTIGDIKEDVRRQCRNALRIDELFLNNHSLADDRSVAHYNLEDGSILETTSNPFWVSCLYIKASEIKQQQEGNPESNEIQKWTQKSLPKKYTLIGLLLNSKNEFLKQPPHFPTLQHFVVHLEQLNKKGATMHPEYTQKDMKAFEREYKQDFLGRSNDPLSAFVDHYAVKLGHLDAEDIDPNPVLVQGAGRIVEARRVAQPAPGQTRQGGKKNQVHHCEDCEGAVAEVYCTDCQGGIALCRRCSGLLHAGATRRRHNVQDIGLAPKTTKSYVPRAFLAPFSIMVAMYSALTEGRLSLTEDEIKTSAQPLTDTDLQDKQNGKYVGGFDCMENVLMAKGFIKKEAARVPTYALTESGHALGEKLYTFYITYYKYLESCRLPKVNNTFSGVVFGNRKLCLLIDENERDKGRLLQFAAEKQIDAQVRLLPAGDYIWILTPPMVDTQSKYIGRDQHNEKVLPFVVERKSWEDFEHSTHSARFQRQVNNMLGSGLRNCFYLMEGSLSALKHNPTQHQQYHLKCLVEKLTAEYGFYVNYTTSWMKSAQWLLWFTGNIVDGLNKGLFGNECISYSEYASQVARQCGKAPANMAFRNCQKHAYKWTAQLYIDHIFRHSHGEQLLLKAVKEDLGVRAGTERHLLIIQDLAQYNKKRQSTLNKCCDTVCSNPAQAREIIEDKIGQSIHNMVHYDISSYWQLYIQVIESVYIVRTETDQDTERIQHKFLAAPLDPTPSVSTGMPRAQNKCKKTAKRSATITKSIQGQGQDEPFDLQPRCQSHFKGQAHTNNLVETAIVRTGHIARNKDKLTGLLLDYNDSQGQGHRKGQIHTINSVDGNLQTRMISVGSNEQFFGYVIKADHGWGRTVDNVIGEGRAPIERSKSENISTVKPRTAIQPFTGVGHCLGTHINETVNINVGVRDKIRDNRLAGLVGGMKDRSDSQMRLENGPQDPSKTTEIGTGDFIDSQNEDDILSQVLSKSAEEMKKPSNEDVMLRLALEISKKSSTETKNTAISKITEEEHQLQIALERSKLDTQLERTGSKNSEETHIQMVLEMSRKEASEKQKMATVCNLEIDDSAIDEEKMVQLAIKMSEKQSLLESQSSVLCCVSSNRKELVDDSEVHGIPDEEDQLKLEFEMGIKQETPKPCQTVDISDDKQLQIALEKSNPDVSHRKGVKRRLEEFKDFEEKGQSEIKDLSKIKESLSEEEQLRIVMELSKKEVETRQIQQANLTCEDIQLKLAIERSKVEHSPRKNVIEDLQLQLAIERSKIEHSPRKKCKLNPNQNKIEATNRDICKKASSRCDNQTNEIEVIEINSQSQEVDTDSDCGTKYRVDDLDSVDTTREDDPRILHEINTKIIAKAIDTQTNCTLTSRKHENILENNHKVKYIKDNDNPLSVKHLVITSNTQKNNLKIKDLCNVTTEEDKSEIGISEDFHDAGEASAGEDSDGDFIPPSPDKVLSTTDERLSSGSFCTALFSCKKQRMTDIQKLEVFVANDNTEKLSNQNNEVTVEKEMVDNTVKDTGSDADRMKDDYKEENCGKNDFSLRSCLFYNSDEDDDDDDDDDDLGDVSDKNSVEDIFVGEKMLDSKINEDTTMRQEFNEIDRYANLLRNSSSMFTDRESDTIRNAVKVEPGTEMHAIFDKQQTTVTKTCNNYDSKVDHIDSQEQQNCVVNNGDYVQEADEDWETNINTSDNFDMNDDNDIDYQPNTEEFEGDTDIDDSDPSELGEDLEKAELTDYDDDDLLPLIKRPRQVRYRELKQKNDQLYERRTLERKLINVKKDKTDTVTESRNQIVTYLGDSLVDETNNFNMRTMDELLAKALQKELDREDKEKLKQTNKIDDEYIARQLDAEWNKVPNTDRTLGNVSEKCDNSNISRKGELKVEDMTKSLKAELNKGVDGFVGNTQLHHIDRINLESLEEQKEFVNSIKRDDISNNAPDSSDALLRELQRKELEKIDKWKQTILNDEKFARQMQEMEVEEVKKNQEQMSTSQYTSICTQPCFKTLVSQHRASREKAIAQLDEYRQLQMNRFQSSRDGSLPAVRHPQDQVALLPSNGSLQSSFTQSSHMDKASNVPTSHGVITIDDSKEPAFPRQPAQTSTPHFSQSQSNFSFTQTINNQQTLPFSQSQSSSYGHMTQVGQSQFSSGSHFTQSSQPQTLKNCNITCGNCGEKGHNRTFIHCPKYHTAEETERRETKMEKQRIQKEEKKKQEVETINMLSEHRQVLEEMTTQIQTEMDTLQARLRRRTSELESQVNSRVKKMEKVNKKKKK